MTGRLTRGSLARRRIAAAVLDCTFWALSLTFATYLRWQGQSGKTLTAGLYGLIMIAIMCQLVIGWVTLYRFTWRVGSFEEIVSVTITAVLSGGVVVIVDILAFRSSVPASSAIGGAAFAFVLMAGSRAFIRFVRDSRLNLSEETPKAIIFGAGDAGQQLIDSLVASDNRPFWPVALLDDDPEKSTLQIRHLKVTGTRADIADTVKLTNASTLIVAIPSADSVLLTEMSELTDAAKVELRVLPTVSQLLEKEVSVADIQPASEADLLGRRAIDTEIDSIARYLTGRRVLVTGAGGSIGSELCRQIHRFGPSQLVMLDRDESGLHQVQLSIEGRAMLETRNLVVCDIRDIEALDAVFGEHQPEVVFHAAALKHLPLLEMWPAEAVKTNVMGTLNMLTVARKHGVATFVNISTDKAANPSSVLGFSKRIAERITATFAAEAERRTFLSVRFGNVLGSRGSVLLVFRSQVEAGGPITVTDPRVTRYFMTIEEAVQLVVQAGAIGDSGDVLILDMGDPVKIDDVAHRFAKSASRPIEIVYTGLRPGEKLHEELIGDGEMSRETPHRLINTTSVPKISTEQLVDALGGEHPDGLKIILERLASMPMDSGLEFRQAPASADEQGLPA